MLRRDSFAQTVSPAEVKAYIISDVLGDNVEDIASGPVSPVSEDYETFKRQVESLDLACLIC